MKKLLSFCLCAVLLFSACSSNAVSLIEMEMTDSYDNADPFINEQLFYVSDNIDTLILKCTFQMDGENGALEIVDKVTNEIVWNQSRSGNVQQTKFDITLEGLEKDKEYVFRFTGTKIKHAKVIVTSDSKLVEEREKPVRNK